jgi:hypothetical protein
MPGSSIKGFLISGAFSVLLFEAKRPDGYKKTHLLQNMPWF